MFITLAGILAIVGALVGGYYFAMRTITLRIAVGPAGSDDIKVVQALTQAFTQTRSQIRLRPIPTDGATASAAGAGRRQGRSRGHPRRSRGAEERPGGGDVAQERRGAVGAATGKGQGQEGRSEDHQDTAARRAPRRRGRAHPGQCQSAQGDPAAIRRRSQQGRYRSVSGQRSRRGDPQPEGGRLSRRRPGQQQGHRGRDLGIDPRWRHADFPRHRFGGSDRAKPSDVRGLRNSGRRLRRLARQARRRGQDHQLLASHRGARRTCRNRRSPPSPGNYSRPGNR